MFRKLSLSLILLFLLPVNAFALSPKPDSVFVRVIDVGQGLCCVIVMPDNHYMIYDTGPNGRETKLMPRIEKFIEPGSTVDLLVISHNDADHICAVDEICRDFKVATVIETGDDRPDGANWRKMDTAIKAEVENDDCTDINLGNEDLEPGTVFKFGEVSVTFICGFNEPLEEWGNLETSPRNNCISIVMRLEYEGHSILFSGDSVGREIGDLPDACIAEEKYMVDHSKTVPIASDVLIVPHHGSDAASSTAFIETVKPKYAIISAGSGYGHPHRDAVERIISVLNLKKSKIFRTDRGDDEGGEEWVDKYTGEGDGPWDDNVDILLPASGNIKVKYCSS